MTSNAECQRQWRKEHPEKNSEYGQRWYSKNKKRRCLQAKQYRQTEKGKINDKKKLAKRRQNLNWISLFENPFDESETIEWHHINNTYVAAIPKDLHRLYMGKYHREKVEYIVRQIYGDSKSKN